MEPVQVGRASDALIEEVVLLQHPAWQLAQLIERSFPPEHRPDLREIRSTVESARALLRGRSQQELLELRGQLRAKQALEAQRAAEVRETNRRAKEAKKEAARFYQQPEAVADYQHWLKLDYWTFDEAIALLLGKEPGVVTWARVQKELNPVGLFLSPKPQPTEFLKRYENLRRVAQRADAMRAPELRPLAVIEWAVERAGLEPPNVLLAFLESNTPREEPEPATPALPACEIDPPDSPPPKLLRRAALIRQWGGGWPTIEADLTHASRNGLSEARGEGFGMWQEEKALEWARKHGKLTGVRSEATALASVWHAGR